MNRSLVVILLWISVVVVGLLAVCAISFVLNTGGFAGSSNPSPPASATLTWTALAEGVEWTNTPSRGVSTPPAIGETPAPITREAQLSYPKKLEIGQASVVRFTIFAEGNSPIAQVGNETPEVPVTLPSFPDLRPRVTVDLEVVGAKITKENVDKREQDLHTFNMWEWEITAEERQDVVLKPHVYVEYIDVNDRAVALTSSVPNDLWTTERRIPASNVTNNVIADSMGDWFNSNLLGLVGIVLGLPGTVISWRELAGKRRVVEPPKAKV